MAETLERDINIKVNTYGIDGAEKKIGNLSKKFTEQQKKVDDLNKKYQELSATMEEIYDEYQNTGDESLLGDFNKVSQELDDVTSKLNDAKLGIVDIGNQFGELGDQLQDQFQGGIFNVLENGFSASSITSLMKMLGASAPEIAAVAASLAVIVKFLDELNQAVDEVTGAYKAAGKAAAGFVGDIALGNIEAVVDTIQMLADGLHEVTDACAEAVNELQEFAELGKEVQDAYFSIYTYLGPKLGSNLIEYTNTMSMLYNLDNKKQLENLRGILAATTQLGLKKDDLLKYTKAFQSFVNDLAVFSGDDISAVASQLENAINMNVLNSRSAVAKALDLNDSDIKKFKELNTQLERANFLLNKGSIVAGLHARYMETDAGKVEQLKNAWENFYNTVGKLALQLWARIAPILTQLLNFATMALNALAKLFNFNLESPIANNSENIAGKYNEIGDAIEETGDKAKDASRKVASFDDVIQINENKSSKDKVDTSGLGLEGYDPSIWLEDFDEDVKDTIFDIDKLKAYIQELLDKFKAWEEGLDWKAIRENARLFGETLADIANVIVDDEQAWVDLGDLVGNSINTIAEALDGFATTFHWHQLGTDIRKMLREMFTSLDTELLGKTLYDVLAGIIDFAIGLFENGGIFTPAAEAFTRIFVEFLNNLSSAESISQINKLISVFITDVLNAINKSLDILEANKANEKISSIVKNIFTSLGKKLPDIIATFSRLLVSEIDLLGDTISSAITGLFEGIEENPDAVETIVNSLISIINAVFGNAEKIGTALYEHKDTIKAIIQNFVSSIADNAAGWGEALQPIVNMIIEVLKTIDTHELGSAVRVLLDKSGIDRLIVEWMTFKLQVWFEILLTKLDVGLQSIGAWIDTTIENFFVELGSLINALLAPILLGISAMLGLSKEDTEKFCQGILDFIYNFFSLIGDAIKGLVNTQFLQFDILWNGLTKGLDAFKITFDNFLKNITNTGEKIKKMFSGLKDSIITAVTNIIEKISDGAKAVKGFFSTSFKKLGIDISIPHMAIGGIVQQSTIANIGEDGAEAVLPLEKNTGWMDVLASKMASRMNTQGGNGNSGSVTVNVGNKGFYTRSEMIDMAEQIVSALRVYGVNISVAY